LLKSFISNNMSQNTLVDLINPNCFQEAIVIDASKKMQYIEQLRLMVLIRKSEEKIADAVVNNDIKCPCHLGIGQEAVAVGIASQIRSSDRVFGAHRSHTHFLSLGGSVYHLFAEVLGKITGCSKGMGGSMHLIDKTIGFHGSVPIVGATVPIATGAALAALKDNNGDVAVSYFGDGAIEEGAVQESFNLAAVMKLPIIFVCENNLFSSHLHIDLRQPDNSTARFAKAHNIDYDIVDGNDIELMNQTAEKAVSYCREKKGPYFIEAITYRWRGHVGPSEDIDVGVKRKDDLAIWKKRDPVKRLFDALVYHKLFDQSDFDLLTQDVQAEIDHSWEQALSDPYPDNDQLFDTVYFDKETV
tara:strand:- start:1362 stop:2435 length:1074 start_codon:yes stop_codon:yes gene_type:complete